MTHTDFPDNISPFPDAGDLLYGHRISPFSSPELDTQSPSPLKKLRPIRGSKGDSVEYSCFPANIHKVEFPEEDVSGNLDSAVTQFQSQLLLQKPHQIVRSGGEPSDCCDFPVDFDGVELPETGGDSGSRWPQAETLALLKIRLEMDAEFRDANPKGPLWEIVSRKLERLGYHRDSKKCKEKFENIYKYYKRTKDRKAVRQGGKYKFFSELEALHGPDNRNLTAETALLENTRIQAPDTVEIPTQTVSLGTDSLDFFPDFSSCSSDDSTSEDVSITEPLNRKRKRKTEKKFELLFENLMNKVIKKQDEMHKQLMEMIDKREKDRIIREEAWKQQELERVKRNEEVRAQENSRSIALISFIQKVLGQQFLIPQSPESSYPEEDQDEERDKMDYKFDSNNRRWPKSEVQALITLRASMDSKFRSIGPKGSAWEEISLAMSSMGYNRSAKKCREKWENINKYFKKTMESGKKRPENAKTCPYFRELDILYKNGFVNPGNAPNSANNENEEGAVEDILTTSTSVSNSFSMPVTLKNLVEVQSDSPCDLSNDIHSSII